MIALLIALALGQNTNQGALLVQQNGTAVSTFRAATVNCKGALSCTQQGTVWSLTGLGADGGAIVTSISATAPITAISDGGNGYTIGVTVPTCTGNQAALQYNGGFACAQIDAGSNLISSVGAVSPIVATPDGGAGVSISFPSYETTATVSLFVDPTGNDSNACTASGTSACLTWAGVLSKLPQFLRNDVTITVAAGSYTGAMTFAGRFVAGNVSVTATLIASTPATGTASGTSTAITNITTGENTLTDATQTWTPNDLRGQFILVGATTWPITSNTATTITIPGNFNAVSPQAYSLKTTGANFTGGLTIGMPYPIAQTSTAAGRIAVSNIGFGAGVTAITPVRVNLTNLRVISTTSSMTVGTLTPLANSSITQSYLQSAGGTTATVINNGTFTQSGNYYRNTTTGSFGLTGNGSWGVEPVVVETTTAGSGNFAVLQWYGFGRTTSVSANSRAFTVRCGAGSTQAAVSLKTGGGTSISSIVTGASQSVALGPLNIVNCATGVEVLGNGAAIAAEGLITAGTTTAINVSAGGSFRSETLPTQSGATTEISLDGDTFTFADINGQSSKVISNWASQSKFTIGAAASAVGGPVARGVLIVPHQAPTLPAVLVGAITGDGDGGAYLGQNDAGWTRICTDDRRCGNAGTINDISGVTPITATSDGGAGYSISISTVPVTKGGTGVTTVSASDIFIGTGMNTISTTTLPNCTAARSALHYNNALNNFTCDVVSQPTIIDTVYVNNVTFAGTNYGGGVLPTESTTVSAARFRLRTAGSGGSTNAVFRASDGSNNCDCAFACNSVAGNYRAACSGSCAFAAGASMTYSVNSIGDCATGPDVQGNLAIEGLVTP